MDSVVMATKPRRSVANPRPPMTAHDDIRIGTLVQRRAERGRVHPPDPAARLRELRADLLAPHRRGRSGAAGRRQCAGCWRSGDTAVISSPGHLRQSAGGRADRPRLRPADRRRRAFGCNLVCGFTGRHRRQAGARFDAAVQACVRAAGRQAEDKGVRIAFENCDMGGTGTRATGTSPTPRPPGK